MWHGSRHSSKRERRGRRAGDLAGAVGPGAGLGPGPAASPPKPGSWRTECSYPSPVPCETAVRMNNKMVWVEGYKSNSYHFFLYSPYLPDSVPGTFFYAITNVNSAHLHQGGDGGIREPRCCGWAGWLVRSRNQ